MTVGHGGENQPTTHLLELPALGDKSLHQVVANELPLRVRARPCPEPAQHTALEEDGEGDEDERADDITYEFDDQKPREVGDHMERVLSG